MQRYAIVLAILATAFLLRVVGQLVVVNVAPTWLPPFDQWQSGILPYPALLGAQALILLFQATQSIQLSRGHGVLTVRRPKLGKFLHWFSSIYAAAMIARYVVSMYLFPENRWLSDIIPIAFHLVLAFYLFVLSKYHRS